LDSAKRWIGHLDAESQEVARAELPKLEEALKALP
jgi:hypothetical protein